MSHEKNKMMSGEYHDLGEEIKNPVEIAALNEESDTKVHYPSLWFHNKSELKDLPSEGTAMIKYKKIMEREENVTINGKSEHRYTTELEIRGIRSCEHEEEMENGGKMKSPKDDEDAIDKGLEAASQETSNDD
jgi:hypothetical protein